MKKLFYVILLFSVLLFWGCAGSNQLDTSETTPMTIENETLDINDMLISNPQNVIGNGYIIINDESDYPSWIKDFRYDCGGNVIDFWNNVIFSVDDNDLFFNCGLSPHRFENGLYGYIDINGNTVIDPIYSDARPFVNNSALVTLDGESLYIDNEGNVTSDQMYNGYNGSLDEHVFYGTFTGKYLLYEDVIEDELKILYGYSDCNGNDTEIKNARKAYSFVNGYAFIEIVNEEKNKYEYYFMNEDFERVTDFSKETNIIIRPEKILHLYDEENFIMGIEYVCDDGYFIVNRGSGMEPSFTLLKIIPDLYNAE